MESEARDGAPACLVQPLDTTPTGYHVKYPPVLAYSHKQELNDFSSAGDTGALEGYLAGQAAAILGGAALAVWVLLPGRVREGLAVISILGAGGVAAWWATRLGGLVVALERVLPAHTRRLLDMTWQTQNALLRLYYDRGALRITHYWGLSDWGWKRLYLQYQDSC